MVETEESVFIFDYYDGKIPKLPKGKTVYFFASHGHFDHCGEAIFEIGKNGSERKYIFSDDITLRPPTDEVVLLVEENECYALDGMMIYTLHSTDLGVAYLIHMDNLVLYHAGDLNWWHWEGETDLYNAQMAVDYKKSLKALETILEEQGLVIDLALLPLDQRQESAYDMGIKYFMKEIEPKIVLPMHFFSENFDICKKVLDENQQFKDYKSQYIGVEKLNQEFNL